MNITTLSIPAGECHAASKCGSDMSSHNLAAFWNIHRSLGEGGRESPRTLSPQDQRRSRRERKPGAGARPRRPLPHPGRPRRLRLTRLVASAPLLMFFPRSAKAILQKRRKIQAKSAREREARAGCEEEFCRHLKEYEKLEKETHLCRSKRTLR